MNACVVKSSLIRQPKRWRQQLASLRIEPSSRPPSSPLPLIVAIFHLIAILSPPSFPDYHHVTDYSSALRASKKRNPALAFCFFSSCFSLPSWSVSHFPTPTSACKPPDILSYQDRLALFRCLLAFCFSPPAQRNLSIFDPPATRSSTDRYSYRMIFHSSEYTSAQRRSRFSVPRGQPTDFHTRKTNIFLR